MAETMKHPDRAIVPYLVVDDAPKEIEFLTGPLGGKLLGRLDRPDGKVMNARVSIGPTPLMISSVMGSHTAMLGMLFIIVPDVDAVYASAIAFDGVTPLMPVADQFWGDRCGSLRSANGVTYWISTHKEDVTPVQIKQRLGMAD